MPLFENNITYPVFNYITVLSVLNYLFDCLNLNVKSIKKNNKLRSYNTFEQV